MRTHSLSTRTGSLNRRYDARARVRRAPRLEALESRQLMSVTPFSTGLSPDACYGDLHPTAADSPAPLDVAASASSTVTPGAFGQLPGLGMQATGVALPAGTSSAIFVAQRDSANGTGGLIEVFDASGAKVGTIDDSVFDTGYVSDVEVGPDGNLYVALDLASDGTGGSGVIVSFKPDGTKLGTFNLPSDPGSNRLIYPFGFDVDADGNFWVVKPNSKTVANVDRNGQELATAQSGANTPQDVAVGEYGPVWSSIGFLNFRSDGNFWATSTTQNATGLIDGLSFEVLAERAGNLPVDAEEDATGSLFVTNGGGRTLQKFSASGASQFNVATTGVPIGLAIGSVQTAPATGSISGVVWNDADGDQQRDAGEEALASWTVYVDADRDGQRDAGELSAQSDTDGRYTIHDVPAGEHVVAQEVPAGWEQTYPGGADGNGAAAVNVEEAMAGITTTASQLRAVATGTLVSTSSLADAVPQTEESRPLIRIDEMRNDPRFRDIDGRGFSTVVIDTGIDLNHPFFGPDNDRNGVADRIVFQYDFADGDADASDKIGHGSNVTSIVASSDSRYTGMAPGAGIIHLKVFDDSGMAPFAAIEAALQWTAQHAEEYNIASVNMSLGLFENFSQETSLPEAGLNDELAALAAKNVLVVSAAGNSFFEFGSQEGVSYPAADPNSLAVSAVWDGDNGGPFFFNSGAIDFSTGADRITSFSQRHSELTDVFAPGAMIAGAGPNGDLTNFAGTSMASPHIAGIAVLAQQLAQRELGRRLTLGEYRELLRESAHTVHDGDDEDANVSPTGKDFPRVDVMALAELIAGTDNNPPDDSPVGVHRVTVRGGETTGNVDFGDRLLDDDIPEPTTKVAEYTIRLTDAQGHELQPNAQGRVAVAPGDEVRIEVYADDLREVGAAGGVFAAYADLTYINDQLDFLPGTLAYGAGFTTGKSGAVNDSARLVDEAGAFQSTFTPTGAEAPQHLFTVSAKVKDSAAPGERITLALDAADQLPLHDTLLFGRNEAVRSGEIAFDSVELEVARGGWHNATRPLDVNDDGQVSPIDALQIINSINSRGSRQLDPAVDPAGPPYVDVNADGFVSPIDALQVVNHLSAGQSSLVTASAEIAQADPQSATSVRIRLAATDLDGNLVTQVNVGDAFLLRAYVEDVREAAQGVFAAYLDVEYASGLSVDGALDFAAPFTNGRSGNLQQPGRIDEAGAFASMDATGAGERLLFTVAMRANSEGTKVFAAAGADLSPIHDVLLHGRNDAVPSAEIVYLGTTLLVVNRLPGDANHDGAVDLSDLNLVRNNFGASGDRVAGDANGDGVVNLADLNEVRNNFGDSQSVLPAPLPASTGSGRSGSGADSIFNTPIEFVDTAPRSHRSTGNRSDRGLLDAYWDVALDRVLDEGL